ncbi:unnamed protein product [marine sediment metagenome]|uniref:Homing endonuclease LAGLIDADG domain-containing protein n=1 Tax=marine sediment metagenome TaxID=412755 RepID=X1E4T7_9ZZZZ
MPRKWSKKEIKILEQDYGNKQKKSISKKLPKRSVSSITHKAIRLGIKRDLGAERGSDIPDKPTPKIGYVLGVIIGDGSIRIKRNHGHSQYNVKLDITSKEIANRFKVFLEKLTGKKLKITEHLSCIKGYEFKIYRVVFKFLCAKNFFLLSYPIYNRFSWFIT